ncbi:TonB-dependent siderophore receptor [Bradyrhizobium sp. LHD-71]|uniref:TonB-dependent receptor n=1 Tax=Bradyrhizobium sp. LHD-71 TaxID=3072141 RepID=UPI0028103A04|nr:TonB-dependent siderophore receptor [Bradyrhizobium sp. LHD-71]MDQ8732401.1 TonB-dependent siderophore receptor [Bradyrhizobium sp. LHD-71]
MFDPGNTRAQATELPEITVNAPAHNNPNSTMTPMPPYAGGQVATGGQIGMLGNRDVMDTPFSQTSYTNKTIQNQQARTVQEVMDNDPSVMATASGTTHLWENDSIRGFRTWSYSAGRSLNGLPGLAPQFSPSIDFIERVEIFKGPSALVNAMAVASGNIGGTINLVTKQAYDEPLTQLTTRYMSRSQPGAHVDVGRRFGVDKEFGLRFNGSFDKGDTPISPEHAQNGTAALNLDYRGERFRLSADIAHVSRDAGAGPNYLRPAADGFPVKAPNSARSLLPYWAESSVKSTVGMIRGELDITDDIMAYGAIGAQRSEFKSRGIGPAALLDSTGNYRVETWREHGMTDVLSMQGGLRAKVTTDLVKHDLNLNVSRGRYERFQNPFTEAELFPGSIYNPVFGAEPARSDFGPLNRRSDTTTSSIGIADIISMFDDRFQFIAGVRYQTIDSTNYSRNTNLFTSEYNSNAWTPAFGLVVKPWQNVSLYASYIEGLEIGTTVPVTYANAGEVFPPYVSRQYETGVKVDWGTVTTTLAVFQIAQPSTVDIASTSGGLPTLALDGEQRNRGIELNAYGELMPGVRLLGGVTFLDARQTQTANGINDGERAHGAPRVRTVIGGEWDTPFIDGLTLAGRFTYTSSQVINNSKPDLAIPSWTTVDLGARYTFASPWNDTPITIRFNVDNVFNKSYWKTAEGNYMYAGVPRTYRLSTTFNF